MCQQLVFKPVSLVWRVGGWGFWTIVLLAGVGGWGVGWGTVVRADEPETPEAARQMQRIAPFITPETWGVGYVNLARLDVAREFGRFAALAQIDVAEFGEQSRQGAQRQAEARKAGIAEFYLRFDIGQMSGPPLVLVPLAAPDREPGVSAYLGKNVAPNPVRVGDMMCAGPPAVLATLPVKLPESRAALKAAFESAGQAVLQFHVAPSGDQRRVFGAIFSRGLPVELGTQPGKVLEHSIESLSATSAASTNGSWSITLKCVDETGARETRQAVKDLLLFLAKSPPGRAVLRAPDNAAEMIQELPLHIRDTRLECVLDPDSTGIRKISPVLKNLVQESRTAARVTQVKNTMRQLGLAMHTYADQRGQNRFPPAALRDKQGKPLLSWRVLLLPYVGEEKLYRKFHLDEPWDSAHNKTLLPRMPQIYRSLFCRLKEQEYTNYLVPLGEKMLFSDPAGMALRDVIDGMSNTIMVVEVDDARAVPWTKPADWVVDEKNPRQGLQTADPRGFGVLFADGSWRRLPLDLNPKTLRALLTANAGDSYSNF